MIISKLTFFTAPLLFLTISLGLASQSMAQAGGDVPSAMLQLLPLALIFAIFWFLLIRPQMKKQKEHQAKIAAVKKGDAIVLSSGIYGKITQLIDDNRIEVEIASGVRVKVAKSMLADVVNPNAPSAVQKK
ncbi:MAG: preprotein translocase subunit YajC [Alphaproteobacteria bacterium]